MKSSTQPYHNVGRSRALNVAPTVPILISAATTICLTVLAGWLTGMPILSGFGSSEIYMQPWTAIGCLSLAVAVFYASTQRVVAARSLLAIPLAIILSTLFQELTGLDLGIDQLLFTDSVLRQPQIHPGRPRLMPAISMLFLAFATLASTSSNSHVQRLITVCACLPIALAILSGTLLPLGFGSVGEEARHAVMSYPTATVITIIAIVILMHRRQIAWPVDPACGLGRDTLQLLLLACVLLPVLTTIWQLRNHEHGHVSHELAEIIQAAVHVAASCLMIAWAWIRIGRESTARWAFSTAIDSAPIAITNIRGQVIHWCKGCERLYGWTFEEAQGRNKYELTYAILPQTADQVPIHEQPLEMEITERRRDGALLRVLETRQVVQPRSDIPPMVVLTMTDITERERRTEMLEAREMELRSILDTVPEALMTVDERRQVRTFSAAAEKLFGYSANEIVGRHIGLLLPDCAEAGPCLRLTPKDETWTATSSQSRTTIGLDHEGNAIPVELAVGETLIGNELVSTAFVRNLSDQIATQVRLDELREQLLHAARVSAMGEMGAGLAHELNQPLTATANLLGAASMRLNQEDSREIVRELIDLANVEVLRAGKIIRHMRAFVTTSDLQIRAVPLNELIADALQLARSGARQAGVALHYRPSASSPEVLADRVQIQQVLVNIISNALDAFARDRPEAPEIHIHSMELEDGNVVIQLLDNGPGFPPSLVEGPLKAFVSTRKNGIGLGLSISRRIIEGHAGTLTFGNRPQGGAVVEFTLPTYREADLKAVG